MESRLYATHEKCNLKKKSLYSESIAYVKFHHKFTCLSIHQLINIYTHTISMKLTVTKLTEFTISVNLTVTKLTELQPLRIPIITVLI